MKPIGVLAAAGVFVLGMTVAGCGDDPSPSRLGTPDTGDSIPRISGLAFISPPTDSPPDMMMPVVRVAIVDPKGVPIRSWNEPITITLSGNTAGAALAGPHTVNAVEGTGTFEGLSVNVEGTYSVIASTPGLNPGTSRPFSIHGPGWFTSGKGLEGAEGGSVRIDPRSPNTLYFSAAGGRYPSGGRGVFKSTTSGQTWSLLPEGLPDTAEIAAIDGASSAVYAVDREDRAWRSDDGAASWSRLPVGDVSKIVVDPGTGGSIWALGNGRLSHSGDAGQSWSVVNAATGFCDDLHVDPTGSSILLHCRDVFRRSTDGGKTFNEVRTGLPSTSSDSLHHFDGVGNAYSVDRQCSSTAPSCTGSIYKLVKGTDAWRLLARVGPDGNIYALATAPSNPSIVYVLGTEGLYKSSDAGESFVLVGSSYLNSTSLTIDPKDPSVLYSLDYAGPSKSTDGGRTFAPIITGLLSVSVKHLAVGAGISPAIYARSSRGVFRSADGGHTWSRSSGGVNAIATDPVHEGIAWTISGRKSIHRTIDGGMSWHEVTSERPPETATATAMLSDGTNLWVAEENSKLWKSTDGGKRWPSIGVDLPGNANALALDPTDPKTLYAATTKGFAKSTNGGASWSITGDCSSKTIGANQDVRSIAISGSYLYLGDTKGSVFVSADRGQTCKARPISGAGTISGLAIDSREPNIVLAATELLGIVRSTDGGEQWSSSNAGSRGLTFLDVISLPTWGQHTFLAASSAYGVFRNTSGGR